MAESRLHGEFSLLPHRDWHPAGWHNDASYNVAKFPLDFTVSIARIRLKGRYGEGFGGAPLRTPSPRPGPAIGDGGERHEQAAAQGSKSAGGDGHV